MTRYSIINSTLQQVEAAGGKDIKATRRMGIVFAVLTEQQVNRLKSSGCKVFPTKSVKTDVVPPTPVEAVPTYTPEQLMFVAGLDDFRQITDPPLYGEGFNIAIVDTGIRETHDRIAGHIVYSKNYTSDPMLDGFDHGTGVASVAVTLAPLCNILNMKVLNSNGEGTDEEVVLAIDDCIDMLETDPAIAPHVINLSLGSLDIGDPDDPLRVACREAINSGIWVFAAAGNDGPSSGVISSPACEQYVGAIGSAKYIPAGPTFAVSAFSSRGPTEQGLIKPDVILFGEDLLVASSKSDTAVIAKSGTSFSCSFISAMALLFNEGMIRYGGVEFIDTMAAGLTPSAAWVMSEQTFLDVHVPSMCIKPEGVAAGKDNDYGYGLPFGPYMTQAITPPALGISALVSALVAIGMMGIMIKGVG